MLVDRERLRQAQVMQGWGVVGGGWERIAGGGEEGSWGMLVDRAHLRQAQVWRYRVGKLQGQLREAVGWR